MNIIEKPWGQEEILETNENYTVKKLTMKDGHKCSLQLHHLKKETIYVLSGILTLYVADILGIKDSTNIVEENLQSGSVITIEPFRMHRMEAKKGDVIYLECSTSQLNDVVRIKDDYNRANGI